jgi:hypothetical protein
MTTSCMSVACVRGPTGYAVHPGVVDTNLARSLGPVLSRVLARPSGPSF